MKNEIANLIFNRGDKDKIRNIALKKIDELLLRDNLSNQAVWHPLGFIYLKLGKVLDGKGTLRFHIWSKKYTKIQDDDFLVHKHLFSFKSFILTGSLTNELYRLKEKNSSNIYTHSVYSVSYENGTDISILTKSEKKVRCLNYFKSKFQKGDIYEMDIDDFHKSIVHSDLLATFCLTYNHQEIPPMVIGNLKGMEEYRYERENCPKEIINELLREIKQRLQ